ncbi:MAG: cytochrome c [Hyphomicrobiales bacterium]
MHEIASRLIRLALPCLFAVAAAGLAQAQDIPGQPSANRGEIVARKVCLVCHIPQAPTEPGTPVKADVPTFPEIAKRLDADGIKAAIISPAHPMPKVSLTQAEMDDVAAYVIAQKPAE